MSTYFLAHATATPSSPGYSSTLKASFASTIFSIPLKAATTGSDSTSSAAGAAGGLDSFLHGPALVLSDNGTGGRQGGEDAMIAFGGNAIVKALCLLSSSGGGDTYMQTCSTSYIV